MVIKDSSFRNSALIENKKRHAEPWDGSGQLCNRLASKERTRRGNRVSIARQISDGWGGKMRWAIRNCGSSYSSYVGSSHRVVPLSDSHD